MLVVDLRKRFLRVLLFVAAIALGSLLLSYALGGGIPGRKLFKRAKRQAFGYYASQTASLSRPATKQKAAIVILCRNSDLADLANTLINVEHHFNRQFKYPYVLINDKPFETKFENSIRDLITDSSGADVFFGRVPPDHWSYPPWIDQDRAKQARKDMAGVMYGDSESYRFMCRYYSGFFFDHPLLKDYKYYWRIEPGVRYLCKIPFDPFLQLERENRKYGFILSFPELAATVPTLMNATLEFQQAHPEYLNKEHNWFSHFQHMDGTFNLCHFWSNFEIASFDFFRSKAYRAYFDFLDRKGGFFYERWGDAPVHSFATGMFLRHDEMMYFKDVGYHHPPINHCPADATWRKEQECNCEPTNEWDRGGEWCLKQFNSYALRTQSKQAVAKG